MEHFWQSVQGFFAGKYIFEEQVACARDGAVFVELGAWKGQSTVFMAVEIINSGKRIEFYSVDSFAGIAFNGLAPKRLDDVTGAILKSEWIKNTEPIKDYVHLIHEDSAKAAELFADATVDFVYVDADHSYPSVTRDIKAWWPKIKPGGVMAGDDLNWFNVEKAITDFFGDMQVKEGFPLNYQPQWQVNKNEQVPDQAARQRPSGELGEMPRKPELGRKQRADPAVARTSSI
jgi:SAM-dependent methyltransferase